MPPNADLLWTRPRSGTRPRVRKGPHCWQNVNEASHSSKAVQGAEILVHARLRKSELIHESFVVKDPGLTVHVIRRTKFPILEKYCLILELRACSLDKLSNER